MLWYDDFLHHMLVWLLLILLLGNYYSVFSDLESFLLISGVSRFSFFNTEHWKTCKPQKILFCCFLKTSTLFQQTIFKLSTNVSYMLFGTIFLAFSVFRNSSNCCSKIENLIVVLLSLAAKSELNIESSCGH